MEKGAKSKKELKDEKLKDQKLEEQILNELSGGSREEQFDMLLAKHIESESSNRRLKQDMKVQEKRMETILREKENLQRDYNKNMLMRDKLQEVCREQQKIIKSMKNENIQKLKEEEEHRKENQTKFQASLNEIHESLAKNNEENLKLRDHNIEMSKKLKFLAEQYRVREQQLEKLNEQIQLESQLQQAKLAKVQVQSEMEKEILLKRLAQTQTSLKDLTEREQALKQQLNWYTSKYDEFQSSLQKSNDIFATYKVEMEKLSKNTRKIEKELLDWKRKYEKSNAKVIELATEKKDRDDHAIRCTKQVDQLQKLLRALQHERTSLYKVLRENNIECPTPPVLPPEPEPLKISNENMEKEGREKMEVMSKSCAEIKQTLASLQSQIKTLKLKESDTNAQLKQENSATISMKQQQQQDEALKKQQKKKKQKSKNKNKEAAVSSAPLTSDKPKVVVESATPESELNVEESCIETKSETENVIVSINPAVKEIIESNDSQDLDSVDVKTSATENTELPCVKEVNDVTPENGKADSSPVNEMNDVVPENGKTDPSPVNEVNDVVPENGKTDSPPVNEVNDVVSENEKTDSSPVNGLNDVVPENGKTDSPPINGVNDVVPENGKTDSPPINGVNDVDPKKENIDSPSVKGLNELVGNPVEAALEAPAIELIQPALNVTDVPN